MERNEININANENLSFRFVYFDLFQFRRFVRFFS